MNFYYAWEIVIRFAMGVEPILKCMENALNLKDAWYLH